MPRLILQTPFVRAYVECALWSSTDNNGIPLDRNYSEHDIAPEALAQMMEDCQGFVDDNSDDIEYATARAGADFWLTRNGHGAGFWDGDWEESAGKRLTDSSKAFGASDLYIGDDGKLYVSPSSRKAWVVS